MFAALNRTHASVRSLAGAPSFGSCWMKSSMAGTISYTGSSRTPSRRSPAASLTARTVARPSASRETTSGGDGGGGRSTTPVTANPAPAADAGPAVSSRSGVPGTGSDCAWATAASPAGARNARSAPTPAMIRQCPRGRCVRPNEPRQTALRVMEQEDRSVVEATVGARASGATRQRAPAAASAASRSSTRWPARMPSMPILPSWQAYSKSASSLRASGIMAVHCPV